MGRTYRAARRRRQRRIKTMGVMTSYRIKRGRSPQHREQGNFWLETPKCKIRKVCQ
jgi:hypothetical protein